MKKVFVMAFLVGVIAVMTGVAFAGNTHDPEIQGRIAEQQKRIDEGIAAGQLTRGEADILQDNLNWIKTEEARLKADGKLTPKERQRLSKMLDRNSDMIYMRVHRPDMKRSPVRRLY